MNETSRGFSTNCICIVGLCGVEWSGGEQSLATRLRNDLQSICVELCYQFVLAGASEIAEWGEGASHIIAVDQIVCECRLSAGRIMRYLSSWVYK